MSDYSFRGLEQWEEILRFSSTGKSSTIYKQTDVLSFTPRWLLGSFFNPNHSSVSKPKVIGHCSHAMLWRINIYIYIGQLLCIEEWEDLVFFSPLLRMMEREHREHSSKIIWENSILHQQRRKYKGPNKFSVMCWKNLFSLSPWWINLLYMLSS